MQTIMFRNMRNKHILCVHTSLYTCIYSIYSVVSPVGTLSISQYSQTWGCFHVFFVSKKLSENVCIVNCSSCHPLLHQLQVSYCFEYVIDRRYCPHRTPRQNRDVNMSSLSVLRTISFLIERCQHELILPTKELLSIVPRGWRSIIYVYTVYIYILHIVIHKHSILTIYSMEIYITHYSISF